jgi:hypothetical protein
MPSRRSNGSVSQSPMPPVSRPRIEDFLFVSCVLSEKMTNINILQSLLESSTATVIALVCQTPGGDLDSKLEDWMYNDGLKSKWLCRLFTGGYVAADKASCSDVKSYNLDSAGTDFHEVLFGVAIVNLFQPKIAVAVGMINAPLSRQGMPSCFRKHICRSIDKFKVRFFTGIFPNCYDSSRLCRTIFRAGAACQPLQRRFAVGNGSLYAWPHRLVVLGPMTEASLFRDEATSWADFAVTHSSPANKDVMHEMWTEMERVDGAYWPYRSRNPMREEPLLSNCQVSFQHSHGFCAQILLSVGEGQAT